VIDRDRRLIGFLSEADVVVSFLKGSSAIPARK